MLETIYGRSRTQYINKNDIYIYIYAIALDLMGRLLEFVKCMSMNIIVK